MTQVSEDYQDYIEEAQPIKLNNGFNSWAEYSKIYEIPDEASVFLEIYPSFSAYNGRALIGDPVIFSGVLPLVFGADVDFRHDETITVGYTAFGKLLCWNKRYGAVEIDLLSSFIKCKFLSRKNGQSLNREVSFDQLISAGDPDFLDEDDEDGKPLFKRAQKKLGPLTFGECYGFRLALPLGGYRTLDKLEKLSAPEHFSFLAQLQNFKLIDWGPTDDFGLRVIREIG